MAIYFDEAGGSNLKDLGVSRGQISAAACRQLLQQIVGLESWKNGCSLSILNVYAGNIIALKNILNGLRS